VTAERTLPESPSPRMHPTVRRISAAHAEPALVEQLAGIEALQALAVTQPLRAVANPRSVVSHRRAGQATVRDRTPANLTARAWDQRLRLLIFAVNGVSVFAVGLLIQVILVKYVGMGHVPSYVVQTIASVQISFLLSRYLTWRDRNVPFLHALTRFNAQQLAITGLGMAGYAGLEQLGMNYIMANVSVTAVLTPVSFLSSHKWSMGERTHVRWRVTAHPWAVLAILAVQTGLALRLIGTNTAYIDEATYLYAGSQEISHWIHGGPVVDYQLWFSGSPVVYPPVGAIASAIGGLLAARILGLCFILGTTTLLFLVAKRLFGRNSALLGCALFAALGTTQFLSGFATYDPMALFLLTLSVYLVLGHRNAHEALRATARLTVIAPTVLALANAAKYATALWDPIVIGLVICASVVDGQTGRQGRAQAVRFTMTLTCLLGVGLAIGKAKYIQGIFYTTVDRSSSQVGMGQSPLLVLDKTWEWIGIVIAVASLGMLLLATAGNRSRAVTAIGGLLLLATIAAPLNQARIGTTVSLQKHVVFGAWFGCILAGYALERILRYRALVGAGVLTILTVLSAFYVGQATAFYHNWRPENPAFVTALRELVHPGVDRYLIEGYDDIPAYYVGSSINSLQWKEAGSYSYIDPQTGITYQGDEALDDAIKHKVFALIILNYQEPQDYAIAADIAKYSNYRIAGHLPPSGIGSHSTYTVWRVTGGQK
jgi:putative flippase GtrA/4-amino-4-deoxy-L-arabinose transferase-like glycosyltransferase